MGFADKVRNLVGQTSETVSAPASEGGFAERVKTYASEAEESRKKTLDGANSAAAKIREAEQQKKASETKKQTTPGLPTPYGLNSRSFGMKVGKEVQDLQDFMKLSGIEQRAAISAKGEEQLREINAKLDQKTAELGAEEQKKNALFLPEGEAFDQRNYNRLVGEIEALQEERTKAAKRASTAADYTQRMKDEQKAVRRELYFTNVTPERDAELRKRDAELTAALQENGTPATNDEKAEYVWKRTVGGAASAGQGILNAVGYLFQGYAAAQELAQGNANTARGIETGQTEEAMQQLQDLRENGLQQTTDFAEKYQEKISEQYPNPTKGQKIAGSVTETVAQMAPSIISNMIVPGSGLYPMAVQVFGNSVTEAKKNGASDRNAVLYGISVAAVEVLTEKMFDGMAGVFGKGAADDAVNAFVQKLVKKSENANAVNRKIMSNPAAQTAILKLADGLGEGFEEFVAEYADNLIDRLLVGADERRGYDLTQDAIQSFLMGALVSGVMQVGGDLLNGTLTPQEAAERMADSAAAQFEAVMQEQAAEAEKKAPAETETEAQVESLALPTPGENVTKAQVEAIAKDRAAMQELGIDTNGKTKSQLRTEIREKLGVQQQTTQETVQPMTTPETTAQEEIKTVQPLPTPGDAQTREAEKTVTEEKNGAQANDMTAEQEGTVNESSNRGQERQSDLDGRLQSGIVAENTERAGDGRNEAAKRADQIRAETQNEGVISARDLTRDQTQPDIKTVKVVSDAIVEKHPELKAITEQAKKRGEMVRFYTGKLVVKSSVTGKTIYARAATQGNMVWIQADYESLTPQQLYDHEDYHVQVKTTNRAILKQTRDSFLKNHSQEELDRLVDEYVDAYFNAAEPDEAMINAVEEELFADMAAGIPIRDGGTDLSRFTPEVRKSMTGEEQETERSRGPPNKTELRNAVDNSAAIPVASELKASREFDEDYMAKAEKKNKDTKNVEQTVLTKAGEDRAKIKQIMNAMADMLPADITGNTFYEDSSYGGSEENSTICPRSMAYEEFMDAVADELGRPLTVEDTVFICQEAMALTDKPECLYCYVAMDRKAYREYLGDYIAQRDAFLADIRSGMEPGLTEPVKKEKGVSRKIPKDSAYGKFLNGRDNTVNMFNRAKLWMESENLIGKSDLSSALKMNEAAQDPALRAQIEDAQAYAQAASWAKKKNGFAAYNGHILNWGKRKIDKLNQHYGLRMYSFSDYSPAFVLENMQMVTDAAVKGLKVLAYTKELDFVRIFAPSGMNINISVFGYQDKNGNIAMDAMQGADWEQAKKLREYGNVGCTFVATNDAQVDWAMAQDWIDVVIPFHIVRTGANVASMFGWKNYTDMSSDRKNDIWEEDVDKKTIYPSEHQNDKETYLSLCAENNLKPRFEKWVDDPNYMKLVNETRQSDAETQKVQPVFNTEYAEASLEELKKRGGYIQHIGGTTETMNKIAEESAAKLKGLTKEEVRSMVGDRLMASATGEEVDEATLREVELQQAQEDVKNDKSGYQASPALKKLGVRIDSPIVNTTGAESLVGWEQRKKTTKKLLDKAIKRLDPTDAETDLAKAMGKGNLEEGSWSLSKGKVFDVNWNKVRELAQYYEAMESYSWDKLAQQRRRIKNAESYEAARLTAGSEQYRSLPMLRLVGNTMKRNMILTAGREAGEAINARYFDPVTRNSAERIRFVNRMLDRVREFKLTKAESEMVQRMIEGTAAAAEVQKTAEDIREKIINVAESADIDEAAKEYHLTKEEKHLAEAYKQYTDTIASMEGMDADKINRAAEAYKEAYDDFYAAINEMLVSHGYDTIGFIKGYAPHMQTDKVNSALETALKMFGLDAPVSVLPTDIAGRTENLKPGKQWNPYFQHRNGTKTDYDAVAGYESYVNYMSNVLYHIDDIQKLRILSNIIREKYAPEEIQNALEYAQNLRSAPLEVKRDLLNSEDVRNALGDKAPKESQTITAELADDYIENYVEVLYERIKENTKLGNLVSVLDDYTNKLAGKQTKLDRSVESTLGRNAINFGNSLSRTFSTAAVVGNLSSALNQLSQLPIVQAEIGNKYVFRAMRDIISGEVKKANFSEESDFLTGKMGVDSLVAERSMEDSTPQQRYDKITGAMSIPFEAVDNMASQLIVRAKYLQEIENGESHENAMKAADDYAEAIVGNRIQGGRPMIYESKNAFVRLVTTFQLEVANAWSHIRNDLTEDIKETARTKGKAAAVKQTAGLLARYSTEAFLLNRLAETVYGGTPAMFDLIGYILGGISAGTGETVNGYLVRLLLAAIGMGDDDDKDRDFDTGAALEEMANLVVGDTPYVRNIASLAGYGDSNLPLPQAPVKTAKSFWEMMTNLGDEETAKENSRKTAKYALKEVSTWLPGGNQIKKTVQGLSTVVNQGQYSYDGNLMYPFTTKGAVGALKAAKAILFGTGALDAQDAYYAAENRALTDKQTEMYRRISGEDPNKVYDLILELRGVEDIADSDEDGKQKRDIIRSADLSDESKLAVYSTMIGESRDESFAAMLDAGMSFDDVMDVMDAYYDAEYSNEKAGAKELQFAKWADEHFDAETAELIKEEVRFWQMTPASTGSYDKLREAGLSPEQAAAISGAFSALEPEDGKTQVSVFQKARAILEENLSSKETMSAMEAIMEESQYQKFSAAKVHGVPMDDILEAMEIDARTEGIKDADGETIDGSKALNVMKQLDGMKLTDTQKTALFHDLGYTKESMWESDYSGKDYDVYYYMTDSEKQSYMDYCDGWYTATKFSEFKDTVNGLTSDKKADGTTISGSKKAKVIEYIDSLNILPDQKTALYAAAGYKESTVDDCPWWKRYDLRSQYYPW